MAWFLMLRKQLLTFLGCIPTKLLKIRPEITRESIFNCGTAEQIKQIFLN